MSLAPARSTRSTPKKKKKEEVTVPTLPPSVPAQAGQLRTIMDANPPFSAPSTAPLISVSSPESIPTSAPAPALSSKPSGSLLRRLTTRLAVARSSPSLRSPPTRTPTDTPRARLADIVGAAVAVREKEKAPAEAGTSARGSRHAQQLREREIGMARDRRRAEALRARGLLPASRRYTLALDADDPRDPFAALPPGVVRPVHGPVLGGDRARGEEEGEGEGGVSAAEALVQTWRERNGFAEGGEETEMETEAEDKDIQDSAPLPSLSAPLTPIAGNLSSAAPEEAPPSPSPPSNEKLALDAWRFPAPASSTLDDVHGDITINSEKGEAFMSMSDFKILGAAGETAKTKVRVDDDDDDDDDDVPPSPPEKGIAKQQPERIPAQVPLPGSPSLPSGLSPAPAPSSALSPPTLSPTSSTATSASTGSGSGSGAALPRTPSVSSHGHSPVRVLEAPREDEEDAICGGGGGVSEFGFAAEEFGFGGLALGAVEEEDMDVSLSARPEPPRTAPSASGPDKEKKSISLFGRRRNTQNGSPTICIPNSNSVSTAPRSAGKPRTVSSLTNLRRTVTSVTAGLAPGARARARAAPSASAAAAATTTTTTTTTTTAPPASTPSLPANAQSLGGAWAPLPLPLGPRIHSRGTILLEAGAIEDEESRRLSELAFLD